MKIENAYLSIAERSLNASDNLLKANLQESSTFYSYHSFESLGGAFCETKGHRYPRSHIRKINLFSQVASRCGCGVGVAILATIISSVRNNCLYPTQSTLVSYEPPDKNINLNDAKDINKRVHGIFRLISRKI